MSELVHLRDGRRIIVRPAEADDRALLEEGFRHLGERSRYQRFLAPKKQLTEGELELFTRVDHHDHEALAALDPDTGEGIGVARFLRLPTRPDAAEVAVTVIDEWQGRGVGWALLERLTRRAGEEGVRVFRAVLLTENRAMLELFRRVGEVHVQYAGTSAEVDVCLPVDTPHLREALGAVARGELRPADAGALSR